jgi:hypothetical protein
MSDLVGLIWCFSKKNLKKNRSKTLLSKKTKKCLDPQESPYINHIIYPQLKQISFRFSS